MPSRMKGKDAQVGVKLLVFRFFKAAVRLQKSVHLLDEVGIDMQESIVEHFVEFFTLLFDELARACHPVELIGPSGGNLAVTTLTELIEFVHVDRAQIKKLAGYKLP